MPSRKRIMKRVSRRSKPRVRKSPDYKYNRKNNLLSEISKSNIRKMKKSIKKSRSKKSSSVPRRSLKKSSPRKLIDLSAFATISRRSPRRSKRNSYRVRVGGSRNRFSSLSDRMNKLWFSPRR